MDILSQLSPDEIKRLALLSRISDMNRAIAKAMRVPLKFMYAKSRRQEQVNARYVAMFIVHQMTAAPLKEIGLMFGGRSHCTVLHGIGRVEADPELFDYARRLQLRIGGDNGKIS